MPDQTLQVQCDDEVAQLGPWFHNLHLPDGSQTARDHSLGDFPRFKWQQLEGAIPSNLGGWSALDIGCNAGFYSVELAKRGATVTGIDVDDHYLRQARWAVQKFDLEDLIHFEKRSVYSLARAETRYDLILFLGVLYHLRYPLLALDTIARLKPRLFVLQTLTLDPYDRSEAPPLDVDYSGRHRLSESDWPKLAFIERTFCDDPTNWWIPNHAAVVGMLRSVGFQVVAMPGPEIYVCTMNPEPPFAWDRAEWHMATGVDDKSG